MNNKFDPNKFDPSSIPFVADTHNSEALAASVSSATSVATTPSVDTINGAGVADTHTSVPLAADVSSAPSVTAPKVDSEVEINNIPEYLKKAGKNTKFRDAVSEAWQGELLKGAKYAGNELTNAEKLNIYRNMSAPTKFATAVTGNLGKQSNLIIKGRTVGAGLGVVYFGSDLLKKAGQLTGFVALDKDKNGVEIPVNAGCVAVDGAGLVTSAYLMARGGSARAMGI